MRFTLRRVAVRIALVAGPAAGALVATRDVTAVRLGATSTAACASRLPGTAARCDSDRLLSEAGPYVGPALVGAVVGLAAVVVVAVVARSLVRAARPRGRPRASAGPTAPAWRIGPVSRAEDARGPGRPR